LKALSLRTVLAAFGILLLSAVAPSPQLPLAAKDVAWLSYGFDYQNTRHVEVSQINPSNVSRLQSVWRFVLGPHEHVETTPIVVGQTMYVTTGVGNNVIALDAASGRVKWRFRPHVGEVDACCGPINRGAAVENGRVFFATLDAHLIALNASTGKPLWNIRIGNTGALSETMAPLAWHSMVFIGSAGGDFGIRGFISAYRARDGKLLWRWYTVSPGWEGSYAASTHGMPLHRNIRAEKRDARKFRNAWTRGGGAVWMTPAVDPNTSTLYAATGNPWPVWDGATRPGDNLFTDSVIALDARTGVLRWYYQQTPHDIWEYEAASPPVLFDVRSRIGKPTSAVGEVSGTGWFYILDRRNGKLIRLSQPVTANSRLYTIPTAKNSGDALRLIWPIYGIIGPVAFDPTRHLVFVTAADHSASDFICAIDVDSGKIVWRRPMGDGLWGVVGGALSTGNLVFASTHDGVFSAMDPETGTVLWQYRLGADEELDPSDNIAERLAQRIWGLLKSIKHTLMNEDPPMTAAVKASPIVYVIDGREYVAIAYDAQPTKAARGAELQVFAVPKAANAEVANDSIRKVNAESQGR
jgi:alcohol dehydrogenase (cytochrome c)